MAPKRKAKPPKKPIKKEPAKIPVIAVETKTAKVGPNFKGVDLTEAYDCGRLGMTQEATARICGLHPATWYEKIKTHPEISEAYKKGVADHQRALVKKLKECAELDGNIPALLFALKCQHGFREQIRHEHVGGGPGSAPIRTESEIEMRISQMSPEQRRERIKELEAKRDRSRRD